MHFKIYLGHVLLHIEGKHGQVQYQREPVSIDKEQQGQEGVDSGFGEDVGVQAVAEVNGVDIVTLMASLSAFPIIENNKCHVPHSSS